MFEYIREVLYEIEASISTPSLKAVLTFSRKVDTGLCGFCLYLFGGDIADGRVDPPPMYVGS